MGLFQLFWTSSTIKNTTDQYCRCVKYAINQLWIQKYELGINELGIENIFNLLMQLNDCASTESQKEIIRLAKREVLFFKEWTWLPVNPQDIAWFLIRTSLTHYNWIQILTLNNLDFISTTTEKYFW